MLQFSILDRPSTIDKLQSEHFDLLIIGGGITGAGIALDAASRGLKTGLVEKNDFAFGTSSRSTKLIHGGLRYLKQLEFGLVKEVGSERAIVHRLAPHLVIPEKMLLPLSEKKGMGYWLTSVGLKIYDWLAGVKAEDQRRMLTKQQTLRYEPLLKKDDVKGGAIYAEYRTDDARLTIEIIKSAAKQGAVLLTYAKVSDFLYRKNSIEGVKVQDQLSEKEFDIRATTIVNAAGPWVDELRDINKSKEGKWLKLTKGVHIVVSHDRLPVKQAIYFNVDDGRMIFAIPRGRTTYIGTTDTFYGGDKDNVFTTREDAVYIIDAVNSNFPSAKLTIQDIESSWAGLRPLIYEEGKSASELSRKDEIFESPSGLISIAGGKLTGYRKMAERVVNVVIKKYFSDKSLKPCRTQSLALTEKTFSSTKDVSKFTREVEERLKPSTFPSHVSRYLVENYGDQTRIILDDFDHRQISEEADLALLKAELTFCLRYEMVCTPLDFFIRRTGLVNFDIHRVLKWKDKILTEFELYCNWSKERTSHERQSLDRQLSSVVAFQKKV
jgi:glycerol-3-phosphate dehydrogenase